MHKIQPQKIYLSVSCRLTFFTVNTYNAPPLISTSTLCLWVLVNVTAKTLSDIRMALFAAPCCC